MEQKPNPELERVRKIQAELEAAEAEKTLLSQPQGEEDMSLLRHMDMDEDFDDWLCVATTWLHDMEDYYQYNRPLLLLL